MIFVLTGVLILQIAFIATMRLVGDSNKDNLNLVQKIGVILFVILDVVENYTVFTILFWEFASNERKTVTSRLKNILHSGDYSESEWRFKLAYFMCKYMIEPWDFGHCKLGKLK